MKQFSLEIITPERNFFTGKVEAITINTLSGSMQILANHTPIAAGLLPSVAKIRENGDEKFAAIAGGFLEFINNKAILLADSAEWPEEIDKARAEEAFERARKRLDATEGSIDKKRAKMALLRASERIKASEIKGSK